MSTAAAVGLAEPPAGFFWEWDEDGCWRLKREGSSTWIVSVTNGGVMWWVCGVTDRRGPWQEGALLRSSEQAIAAARAVGLLPGVSS